MAIALKHAGHTAQHKREQGVTHMSTACSTFKGNQRSSTQQHPSQTAAIFFVHPPSLLLLPP